MWSSVGSLNVSQLIKKNYFRSDKTSWDDSYMILEDVVRHGENGGFKVPCLIVSASNDTESHVLVPDDSYKVIFKNSITCLVTHIIVCA